MSIQRPPTAMVLAGRAFKEAFDALKGGPRAILRRADDPMCVAPFWECFQKARECHENVRPRFFAAIIPLMDLLRQKDDVSRRSVGGLLATHRGKIALRRVESLFAAESLEEAIENLDSIFGILGREASIDYGRLFDDLRKFGATEESRAGVRRRWAETYFGGGKHV